MCPKPSLPTMLCLISIFLSFPLSFCVIPVSVSTGRDVVYVLCGQWLPVLPDIENAGGGLFFRFPLRYEYALSDSSLPLRQVIKGFSLLIGNS